MVVMLWQLSCATWGGGEAAPCASSNAGASAVLERVVEGPLHTLNACRVPALLSR